MNPESWLWLAGPGMAEFRAALLYAISESDHASLIQLAVILLSLNLTPPGR